MAMNGKSRLYRTSAPVVDARYDEDSAQTITGTLITAVAEAAAVDPIELPPLYETIDTDAIEQLFERHNETVDSPTTLSFTVETWNVFVRSDGRVRVCDETQVTEPAPVFANHSVDITT
jgi:hypothetical protein